MATNYGTYRGLIRHVFRETAYLLGAVREHERVGSPETRRLVFVCLGNINRSAFAEAVARSLGAKAISIGMFTTTGAPACTKAVQIAPAFGVSLDAHVATDIVDYQYRSGDMLCAMEIRHRCRMLATELKRLYRILRQPSIDQSFRRFSVLVNSPGL